MKKTLIAVAALAVSGVAVAGPSWTYVDAGYARGDSDAQDTEGYSLRGSFGLDMFHGRVSFYDAEIAGGKGNNGTDDSGYEIVVGSHPAITDNTDFVVELGYFDAESDDGSKVDSDGYSLGVGVRSMISDNFELSAGVASVSGDSEASGDFTEILATAGGQYLFNDNIGLGVDVNVGDGDAANFYVRWSF